MNPVLNTWLAQHAGNGNREALLAEVPHLFKSIRVPDQEGPQLRAYRLCRVDFSADERTRTDQRVRWRRSRFGIFSNEQDFRILGGVMMMMMMMMMMMVKKKKKNKKNKNNNKILMMILMMMMMTTMTTPRR